MIHMRILGTEPPSVILKQMKSFKKLKMYATRLSAKSR